MNNADSNQPQVEKLQTADPKSSREQVVVPKGALMPTPLTRLKNWLGPVNLPAPVSLAAVVLAAFLILPAYWGLVSGRTIRQLRGQIDGLQQSLKAARDRSLSLDLELSQRNIQLLQRPGPLSDLDSGLFVSPLVSLEPKRSTLPDLIRIGFAHSDQAVLVFYPPTRQIEEIEVKILQGQRLVWSQILPYTSGSAATPNLVTLILSRYALPPGGYQLNLAGNPAKQRMNFAQFDLTVER
jgi:hypothetical protein